MTRFVTISGCSGGGKSSLIDALAARGFAVIEEPGRRIVAAAERAGDESRLPWVDPRGFAEAAVALALADFARAETMAGPVFFDRGLIDALSALEAAGGAAEPGLATRFRYDPQAFLLPPWPEIYRQDGARRHGLAEAVAEYDRLCRAFPAQGYAVTLVPKAPVEARADFVLARLGLG